MVTLSQSGKVIFVVEKDILRYNEAKEVFYGISFRYQCTCYYGIIQGFISFFSPCVLPLLPLYIGYLSGGTGKWKEGKVLRHTIFFVLGISATFFILGLGVSALGTFFSSNQALFARIGGVIVFLFGLYQLGVFGNSDVLSQEKRLPFRLDKFAMSPWTAFVMGFTFSFAWTPCVGPTLTSVLLMAATAGTRAKGMALIGVYTLGFVIPFLFVGIFTTKVLGFFKKHMSVVQYTVKIGGILMVIMGVMMFTGTMNSFTNYLSDVPGVESDHKADEPILNEEADNSKEENAEDPNALPPALDFELQDQFGTTHTLDEYKGKVIFLNFWATWCGPCRAEMPEIQDLYEKYKDSEDVVVLGVAAPSMGKETSQQGITEFLETNEYTYPVLMDTNWELFQGYGISAFPTTFMIDVDGNVYGAIRGQLTYDIMEDIIRQTKNE